MQFHPSSPHMHVHRRFKLIRRLRLDGGVTYTNSELSISFGITIRHFKPTFAIEDVLFKYYKLKFDNKLLRK
jgi:hypothetical protein